MRSNFLVPGCINLYRRGQQQRPASGTRNEKNPTRPDPTQTRNRIGFRVEKKFFFGFRSGFGLNKIFFRVRVGFRVLKIFFGSGSD